VRFGGREKGESCGYRVISFFSGTDIPVFLLNIFVKNEKAYLTSVERRNLKNILADIAKAHQSKRESG
jgi:hypothetical protein